MKSGRQSGIADEAVDPLLVVVESNWSLTAARQRGRLLRPAMQRSESE
jgi:hypothetical protein